MTWHVENFVSCHGMSFIKFSNHVNFNFNDTWIELYGSQSRNAKGCYSKTALLESKILLAIFRFA